MLDGCGIPFLTPLSSLLAPRRVLGTTVGHPGTHTPNNINKNTFWDLILETILDDVFMFKGMLGSCVLGKPADHLFYDVGILLEQLLWYCA